MLIIGPSGSGKTNTLLHLIDKFHPIDKICLYAKDTDEEKYQYLINKREQVGIKNLNDPHAFIEYSNDMNDVLEDINNYNKNRDKKVFISFDDMIADIMRSEKFKAIVKELFINILYIPHNTKKIQLAYRSKNNLTCDKQVILLMINDGEKWYYLVVKNLPGLLKGITSTHMKDFYCLNCFHSYRTKNKLESHKKICENHDYCHVEMPTKDNNIIKYNHGENSMKVPFIYMRI